MELPDKPLHELRTEVDHHVAADDQIEGGKIVELRRKRVLHQVVELEGNARLVLGGDGPPLSFLLKAGAPQAARAFWRNR